MTFTVGTRFTKRFSFEDFTILHGYDVYWAFTFYNGDVVKITGQELQGDAEFTIPADFFTVERIGPLTHKFIIKDVNDSVPTIDTIEIKDKLIRNGPTPTELGI